MTIDAASAERCLPIKEGRNNVTEKTKNLPEIRKVFLHLFCKHHSVVGKFFSAGFFKFCKKIRNSKFFLIFAGNIKDNAAVIHHDKAVAVFDGVVHVMGYHKGCKVVFGNDLNII